MKPVILHTGRSYTVEERRERAQAEDVYRVGRLRMEPPDELSERAKLKFRQIVGEAFWLDELSVDLLSAYCHAWDRWLDCVEAMKNMDEVIITQGKNGEASVKQNPYRQPLRTYIAIMSEMSAKLGLGNIDRLKLSIPDVQKKEENPFDMFMEMPAERVSV